MKRRELMKYSLFAAAPAALPARLLAAESPKEAGAVPDARLTAPLPVPAKGDIQVAFLIGAGAEVVDFAGPWGVFEYVSVGAKRRNPFSLYTVAASKVPVKVSGGMTLVPDHTFADAPAPNVVVVPALSLQRLSPAAFDWLRTVQKSTDVTMSVCDGSYVLAQSGLVNGKTVTAHHNGFGMLRATYPAVNVIRGVRYVEDGKFASSGGLTSGMDLAMRVVERYFGRDVAKQTALSLEYQGTGWMHPESNAQFAKRAVSTDDHPLCPVCEMDVSRESPLKSQYQGKTYYFCSDVCQQYFTAAPAKLINAG